MALGSCRALPVPLSLLVLTLSGCGSALHGEDESRLISGEAEIRIANSLTTDALVLNAISANAESNELLATTPLSVLFHPTTGHVGTRQRLHDLDAQRFMSYLVGCALGPSASITWYDPRPPTPGVRQWFGQAGLCPQWASGVPSADCLQRVSACLLARNNALGQRVELSMRGQHRWTSTGPNIYQLEAKTRPADHDPVTSLKMPSFQACGLGEQGEARDCGWTPDGIGVCDASGVAQVGAGGSLACPASTPTLGSSSGQVVVRVCDGVLGCDHGSTRNLGEATGSCAGPAPVVSFSCTPGQYFSVMTAPWSSTTAHPAATVAVTPTSTARYGLAETEVYAVREGAFYGNLFGRRDMYGTSTALAEGVNVEVVQVGEGREARYEVVGDDVQVTGSIYRNMYSCFDPAWASGAAYSSSRLCAMPNTTPSLSANCAAKVTGACFTSLNPPSPGKCAVQDGPLTPGDRDYEQCKDLAGNTWMHPVTTFLHAACDTTPRSDGSKPPCSQK